MRIAKGWANFELIDASCGERLERWGDLTLIRPDPQVIWKTKKDPKLGWADPHATYRRSDTGGGRWITAKPIPNEWTISYKNLSFVIKPTGFKHTGLFPEQAANWEVIPSLIEPGDSILNLFAYTGGATLACAAAGGSICHVDASKGMVAWARENAKESGLAEKPIRWIVDDCQKFVSREIRRGKKYSGIIMDPPSYGRGPNGEVWKLEDSIFDLTTLCAELLNEDSKFFLLNSYTTGLAPSVMGYLLESIIRPKYGGKVTSYELGIPVTASGGILPCGSSALWTSG